MRPLWQVPFPEHLQQKLDADKKQLDLNKKAIDNEMKNLDAHVAFAKKIRSGINFPHMPPGGYGKPSVGHWLINHEQFGEPTSLGEVANTFNISRERVRQLESRALKKLRRSPETTELRHYLT